MQTVYAFNIVERSPCVIMSKYVGGILLHSANTNNENVITAELALMDTPDIFQEIAESINKTSLPILFLSTKILL